MATGAAIGVLYTWCPIGDRVKTWQHQRKHNLNPNLDRNPKPDTNVGPQANYGSHDRNPKQYHLAPISNPFPEVLPLSNVTLTPSQVAPLLINLFTARPEFIARTVGARYRGTVQGIARTVGAGYRGSTAP